MDKPTVFISYCQENEVWKDRLVKQLKVLEYEGYYELWDDQKFQVGSAWLPEIEQALERSSVAVMMITADFLISKFIREKEIPIILQRYEKDGLWIFPVIVESCPWKKVDWLSSVQIKPKGGVPLETLSDIDIRKHLTAFAYEIADLVEKIEVKQPVVPLLRGVEIREIENRFVDISHLPTTPPYLFGRDDELALLDRCWEDSETHIVSIEAFGGFGKTALVNTWLDRMKKDDYRGAVRVFGRSFYSQGSGEDRQVSADSFIAEALRLFGDPSPDEGSPSEKGERLAECIKKQRTLLILDGMEPLQDPHQNGRIKDSGLQSLLRELAFENPGLCVITTRLHVSDLDDFTESAHDVSLEKLTPEAGAELLTHLGVEGTPEELREASNDLKGHALSLTLLGNYLVSELDGDIRRRGEIPALMDEKVSGKHAAHVMQAYERMFEGKPELDVLRLMGLFDRPVQQGALDALLQEPVIEGLTGRLSALPKAKWKYALRNLRSLGLLNKQEPGDSGALDCHPLIREHFGDRLQKENPAAWKEANNRLYEYYQSSAKEFPDTIEEMEPLYAAVMHGCRAGRYQEAFDDVYRRRIDRGNEYFTTNKLGAFGVGLAAVSYFFEKLWDRPAAELNEPDQAYLLNEVGIYLRALGRLREAFQPMKAGVDDAINREGWVNAASGASNLSELFLTVGVVDQSVETAWQSVKYADLSGDDGQKRAKRTTLADAQHQAGRLSEAEIGFGEAEAMQKEWQPEYPLLYSLWGYRYCDLLLSQGKYSDVKRRAEQTIEWARREGGGLLDIALDMLSLGRAECMRVLLNGDGDFGVAGDILSRAVDSLRKAELQDYLLRGLLARAELYQVMKDFEHAHRDLRVAMTIVTRGEMRLFEADCWLQYGRLYLAEGDAGKAREELEKAEGMIEEMGYGRRKPEVLVDYARLLLHEGKREEAREYLRRGKALVEEMGYHCLDKDVRELEAVMSDE